MLYFKKVFIHALELSNPILEPFLFRTKNRTHKRKSRTQGKMAEKNCRLQHTEI